VKSHDLKRRSLHTKNENYYYYHHYYYYDKYYIIHTHTIYSY